MIFSNNKGSIDMIVAGVIFVIMILVLAIYFTTITPLQEQVIGMVKDDYLGEGNVSRAILDDYEENYHNFWDGAFIAIFGIFWIGNLIMGYRSDTGKFFMIILFLVMLVLLLVAGQLTDYWNAYVEGNDDISGSDKYPSIYWLMENFMLVVLMMIGSGVLVSFISDT